MMVKFGKLEIEFNNIAWYQDKAVIDAIATSLGASRLKPKNNICNSVLRHFGTRLLIRVFKVLYAMHEHNISYMYYDEDVAVLARWILCVLQRRVVYDNNKSAFIELELNPNNERINRMLHMMI